VRSFPAPKWLILILLLALTIGWKVVARSTAGDQVSDRDIQAAVAEFLARQHFAVSVSEKVEESKPSVGANSGSCRILVARSPAVGYDRDLIQRYAEADDHVFVVFRGQVYTDQPTFLTVSDALWSRFRRELGFAVEASPVLAVVAKTNCEAERLPWRELRIGRKG
jgi:hypothetical protein